MADPGDPARALHDPAPPESRAAPEVGRRAARVAAVALVLLGLLVLLGWVIGSDALRRVVVDGPRMKPYTAIAFVVTGLAVLLPRARAVGLLIVLTWSVLSGGEWFLGALGGFDQWLIGSTPDGPQPGRAARPTVIAFGALALAGLVDHRAVLGAVGAPAAQAGLRCCALIRAGLLVIAAGTAYGALVGYLVGNNAFYGSAGVTGSAVHTALGLLVAVFALVALEPERAPARWLVARKSPGSSRARGWPGPCSRPCS